jgi:hypothetical protein
MSASKAIATKDSDDDPHATPRNDRNGGHGLTPVIAGARGARAHILPEEGPHGVRNRPFLAYVDIVRMSHPPYETNDSYRLHRANPEGSVAVFNQDGFLMAEYNPITGTTAWHRVVPATKRESIERKLLEQFPVAARRNASANTSRSTRRKARR